MLKVGKEECAKDLLVDGAFVGAIGFGSSLLVEPCSNGPENYYGAVGASPCRTHSSSEGEAGLNDSSMNL
eukprot:1923662-Amphidinium_carterae.1